MVTPTRPAPMFVGEHTALDFLNSVATPRNTEFDWLATGEDLLNWCVAASLCHEDEIAHLRSGEQALALADTLRDVHNLRKNFRALIDISSDQASIQSDHAIINQINKILSQGALHFQIDRSDGTPPRLSTVHRIRAPADLLPRIAAACAALICDDDFQYVRNCEGPTCTLYFKDVSKNHRRRWCSMEVCGNRAKAAAHRKRD